MFDILSKGFKDASLKLKGQGRLTEDNMGPALDEVKRSLLDADVDYGVVKEFLSGVKEKAAGSVVALKSKSTGQSVGAGDHFVQLCHDGLVELLGGDETPEIVKNEKGPTVILLVGLQGAGKTTHAAKLAKLMKEKHNMRPLLVAADVYRPAARDQLKVLGEKIDVPVFTKETSDAVAIAKEGVAFAREEWKDLVIVDTAGRLAIDADLMDEIDAIKREVNPQNTLLVIDSMIGQDAVRTASAFDTRLDLTGVILTKLDGDTRGGAALSIRSVTGKRVYFAGTGEGLDKLEEFRPEGMAGRILGMGDIVGLMDDFSKVIDEEKATKKANKIMEGDFDFDDFLEMMQSIQKMGPIKDVISKTPLAGQMSQEDMSKVNDKELTKIGAMVQSMTRQERRNPDLLLSKSPGGRSRSQRISKGSGSTEKDVRDLVDRFMQMRQMMQLFGGGMGGGGMLSKIPGMGGLSNLANMAKMARNMGGGGGMGGLGNLMGGGPGGMMPPGMENLMGGGQGGPRISTAELAEINRMKKKKKEEKRRKANKKKRR